MKKILLLCMFLMQSAYGAGGFGGYGGRGGSLDDNTDCGECFVWSLTCWCSLIEYFCCSSNDKPEEKAYLKNNSKKPRYYVKSDDENPIKTKKKSIKRSRTIRDSDSEDSDNGM